MRIFLYRLARLLFDAAELNPAYQSSCVLVACKQGQQADNFII